jgi:hypothetical protein
MGCFSFLCKECGRPINSDSFRGERCWLFLVENGVVIESMNGEYDSYGRVFDETGKSIKWSIPWSEVCNIMFKKDRVNNGIAAYHEHCYPGIEPKTSSDDDPNQGWGSFKIPDPPFIRKKK